MGRGCVQVMLSLFTMAVGGVARVVVFLAPVHLWPCS